MSYAACSFFLYLPTGWDSSQYVVEDSGTTSFYSLPTDYVPKLSKLGDSSKKIFSFEGARYWNVAPGNYFDYTTVSMTPGLAGTPQGNFHSRGPGTYDGSGEPYLFDSINSVAPLKSTPGVGYRLASLRHKGKMIVLFFDGHVTDMTFVQAADPNLWAPRNSKMATASGLMYNQLYPGNTTYHLGSVVQ